VGGGARHFVAWSASGRRSRPWPANPIPFPPPIYAAGAAAACRQGSASLVVPSRPMPGGDDEGKWSILTKFPCNSALNTLSAALGSHHVRKANSYQSGPAGHWIVDLTGNGPQRTGAMPDGNCGLDLCV